MKPSILFLLITICLHSFAQFDERFYYPKAAWNTIADSIDYEEVNFKIKQGKISGLLLNPKGDFKGNILYFHGAGGNVTTYLPITTPLASLGYRILMIDVRGYGKSEGKPTHIGIAEDGPEILNWVLKQKNFKNHELIIYGASMGTQIATHLSSQFPEKVQLLILDGPMTSFTDIALHSAAEEQKAIIQQFVTSPYSAKEDIQQIKNTPVLIIHSEGDTAVPLSQGQELYKLASEPKEIWEYEGEHLEAAKKFPKELSKKIEALTIK